MQKDRDPFDFWYAVNNTEVKLMPTRHLETFGATVLNYYLISELMDSVDRVRVREGRLHANKPQIITPEAYSRTALEGFGDEARKYVDWLKEHEQDIRILQYGYTLRQEAFTENILTESLEAVVARVTANVKAAADPLSAVVVGVDDPWDVCLVRLFWEVIQKSALPNIRDMQRRSLFDDEGGVPRGVRGEIEQAFRSANKEPSRIPALGHKLHTYGLFEEYEDRFFSLVKSHRRE
jgi:hypothetical protein